MTVIRRTKQTIVNSMQSYLQNLPGNQLTDFNTGSVLNSLLNTVATELENLYNENYQVYLASYISSATGTDLDNKASDYGLTRIAAGYSSGYLIFGRSFASNIDIPIPIGTIATTATSSVSNAIQYETTEFSTLPAGGLSVRVAAASRDAGADGNVNADSIVVLTNPPSGIEYVTNASTFSGGRDEETDQELRDRITAYLNSLQRGTVDSLQAIAKTVNGVVDAYVEENMPSLGYAYCWVADSTGTATNQLLSDVQSVLNEYKPLGTTITAKAPIVHPVDIEMWVSPLTGFSFSTIRANIESDVTNYLNAKRIGEDLNRSELINVIQGVNGVNKINTNTETLVENEGLSTPLYCSTESVVPIEKQYTEDKATVNTDFNCYSVQSVYLTSDSAHTGTDYKMSWDRDSIVLNDVPIQYEYHVPTSINTVETSHTIETVSGVFTDSAGTSINYYLPSGSATGTTVYLGTALPTDSTPVYITYVEYGIGSNTNTQVDIAYTRQKVDVANTIASVKGVYAASDTSKTTDYYFGGTFSDKTIYLGKAFSTATQAVVVDYWSESASSGLVPYDDISVANSSTARMRTITVHQST